MTVPWLLPFGKSLTQSTNAAANTAGGIPPAEEASSGSAVAAIVPAPQPAVPAPPPVRLSPAEQLTLRRAARSRNYLARAWRHFKANEYHRALATFRLAGSVTPAEPEAEPARGALYAALAMERYVLAGTLLARLLRKDPQLFLREYHIADRYETPAEHDADLQRMRASSEVPGAGVISQALFAYTLWQNGERLDARAVARSVARRQPDGPFAIMVERMLAAEAGDPSSPNPRG